MTKHWWKVLAVFSVLYTIIFGFLGPVPRLSILNETIRVLYFHVPMWFSMIILMGGSLVFSIQHLHSGSFETDLKAREAATTGFILAFLGMITGSIWARFTWGEFWVNDSKLNGTAATMLIYLAYFVLRSSVEDEQKKGRLAAVHNVFAFVMMIVFIGIFPRMTDSLHPGNGGNLAFGRYDLNNNMRMVFYPALVGWTLIGVWMTHLKVRYEKLRLLKNEG